MDEGQGAIRKVARWRSSVLPGSGLALLGHPRLAALGLAGMALLLATMAVVSFYPGGVTTWLALASLLGSILLWAFECIAVGRIAVRPSGESGLVSRHFVGVCVLAYSGAVAASVCLVLNFGSLVLRGDGMIPVIYPGERILYHKQVVATDLVLGRIIAFRVSAMSSWGSPGTIVIGRILAAPRDAIGIGGTRYRVNGKESGEVSAVGRYQVVLDIPEVPAQSIVPPDCFFVVQEQPARGLDSRTLSWARREDVLATKLWLLSRRGPGQALR
jgi:Signal peptidase, peptidase S26